MSIFLKAFDYWVSGGLLLIPIGIVSFLIWVYFLSLHRHLKTILKSPPDLGDRIKRYLEEGKSLSEVNRWLSKFDGIIPEWASRVLMGVVRGVDVSDTMNECRVKELPLIEREMTILSALVIAAPMLGLLGTVLGMTTTFWAVAQQSADTTDMVAGGISQALITTQLGLVSAIPGVFGLAYLRHMYGQLETKINILEKHLSLTIQRVVSKTSPQSSLLEGKG